MFQSSVSGHPTSWSTLNSTITNDAGLAPDGSNQAALCTAIAATSVLTGLSMPTVIVPAPRTYYTFSLYCKPGTLQYVMLELRPANIWGGSGIAPAVWFDLVGGTQSVFGGNVNAFGTIPAANGFTRCWLTALSGAAPASAMVGYAVLSDAAKDEIPPSFAGTETLLAWGAQISKGVGLAPFRRTP